MRIKPTGRPQWGRRPGAIVPLVAIFLPVVLTLASFVVNLAYMELTRTELRIATDAASRAAGHKLVASSDKSTARSAARDAGQRNAVAGDPLQLDDADIVFGRSVRSTVTSRYTFAANADPPNSVQIVGRRNQGSASGVVSLVVPSMGAVSTFQPVQTATSTQAGMDVALVLDRSGSMAYGASEASGSLNSSGIPPASAPPGWSYCDAAPPGSRWIDLSAAVETFLTTIEAASQSIHIGMASYNSTSKRDVDLTGYYSSIRSAIGGYTGSFCSGATNIGSGISRGALVLTDPTYRRPGVVKLMVVMTDGRHNTGSDPLTAATSAANEGILIYTVTFSAEADTSRMQSVASIGGGKHYHATTSEQLEDVFREIAKTLPTMLTQ